MYRRHFITLAAIVAAGAALRVSAAAPIRMAYFDTYWPLSRRNPDGKMSGALIDAVDLVGRGSNLVFEHFGYPWARAQVMVERGELDAFCTLRTQPRLLYATFCPTPLVTLSYGVFHRSDDLRPALVTSIAELRRFRQGTYRGSGYAREHLETDRLVVDDTQESVLRRIAMGDLDTLTESEMTGGNRLKAMGLADKVVFSPLNFLPKAEYRFGLRSNFPESDAVLARVEAAAQVASKTGALSAIVARYQF